MERTNAQILEALRRYRESTENGIVVFYGDPYIDQSAILAALVRDRVAFSYAAQCERQGAAPSFLKPPEGDGGLLHRTRGSDRLEYPAAQIDGLPAGGGEAPSPV